MNLRPQTLGYWEMSGESYVWVPEAPPAPLAPPRTLEEALERYDQSNFDSDSAAKMARMLGAPLRLTEQRMIDAVPVFGDYHRAQFNSGYTEASNYVLIAVRVVADALTRAGGDGAAYIALNQQNILNGAQQAQARWQATQKPDNAFGAIMQIAAIAAAIYTGGASLGLWNAVTLATVGGVAVTPSMAVSLVNIGVTTASGGDPTSALVSLGTQLVGPMFGASGGEFVGDLPPEDYVMPDTFDTYTGEGGSDAMPDSPEYNYTADASTPDFVGDLPPEDYAMPEWLREVTERNNNYQADVDALNRAGGTLEERNALDMRYGFEPTQFVGDLPPADYTMPQWLQDVTARNNSYQAEIDALNARPVYGREALEARNAIDMRYGFEPSQTITYTVQEQIANGTLAPGDAVQRGLVNVRTLIEDGDMHPGEAVARGFIGAEEVVREGWLTAGDAIKMGLLPAAVAIAVATAAGASGAEVAAAQAIAASGAASSVPASTPTPPAPPRTGTLTPGQIVTAATTAMGVIAKILTPNGTGGYTTTYRNAAGQLVDAMGRPIGPNGQPLQTGTGNPLLVDSGVDGVLGNLTPMVRQLIVPALIVGGAYLASR